MDVLEQFLFIFNVIITFTACDIIHDLSLEFVSICYFGHLIQISLQEILTRKSGAVQNSPPDKSQPEPSPWSPVWLNSLDTSFF